jgi:hypothetical protein
VAQALKLTFGTVYRWYRPTPANMTFGTVYRWYSDTRCALVLPDRVGEGYVHWSSETVFVHSSVLCWSPYLKEGEAVEYELGCEECGHGP